MIEKDLELVAQEKLDSIASRLIAADSEDLRGQLRAWTEVMHLVYPKDKFKIRVRMSVEKITPVREPLVASGGY